MKTIDLDVGSIRQGNAERVRAHVFLRMLAYHVEWHLRQALVPLLFHDADLADTRTRRGSPVARTESSEAVKAKKGPSATPTGSAPTASPV
jgi:hypothetical protein